METTKCQATTLEHELLTPVMTAFTCRAHGNVSAKATAPGPIRRLTARKKVLRLRASTRISNPLPRSHLRALRRSALRSPCLYASQFSAFLFLTAMCGAPLAVPHARHTAPPEQADYIIDAMVQYNCFVGYESKGFAKAKCLFYNGTAQWFGPDLKCIRKFFQFTLDEGVRRGR